MCVCVCVCVVSNNLVHTQAYVFNRNRLQHTHNGTLMAASCSAGVVYACMTGMRAPERCRGVRGRHRAGRDCDTRPTCCTGVTLPCPACPGLNSTTTMHWRRSPGMAWHRHPPRGHVSLITTARPTPPRPSMPHCELRRRLWPCAAAGLSCPLLLVPVPPLWRVCAV